MTGASLVGMLLTTLLSGGFLGALLKYRLDNRRINVEEKKLTAEEEEERAQRKRTDLDRALEVVTRQRDDALGRVTAIEARLDKTELEVQGLRFARDLDPFPNWIVALDGKYLYVNREFERQFLEPLGRSYHTVIGQKHEDIWPEAFVHVLRDLDAVARRVPDGRARARTAISLREGPREVTVHKFPLRIREAVVGFAGFITDVEVIDELPLSGSKGTRQ